MEKPHLEGIVLKSKREIESESEKVLMGNLLQLAYASKLQFLGNDEGSSFEVFLERYGEAIRNMLKDNPEILETYSTLLREGKEKDFNFEEISNLLKSYLARLH